jgi:small subunit ribosomal protein S7
MSRRGGIQKREITPDARYQDKLVARLIAYLMLDGKKSVAEGIVYGAFDIIKDKVSEEPVTVFKQALDHIRPSYEVKSRRVGGASYQVPVEVKPGRSTTLALRWLVGYSRKRREKTMTDPFVSCNSTS